ncbi:UNVERIFIED_CONTAM: hypothetical protein PYX00_008624 [Menopon gallinae]|uniref:Protein kinase domain-containing protein n=1 Tax=Menopon gallinae TaxID=328185 RepID=A0AAW2HNX7_9NEOP
MNKEMPMDSAREGSDEFWVCDPDGRKLEDEYLLGDVVGRGTFSTIYKCLRKGRTEWTCKVLDKKRMNRNSVKSVLPKLLKLKHPNIMRMKEVFETETSIQLIVEYVSGPEIFEKIVEKGQFSEQDAAQTVRDILKALKYLHGEGVVHGDIKPENLLYENDLEESKLKLDDFGLSQLSLDKDLMVNSLYGSGRYCAPEVLLGKEPGYPSDLWGLGVIMFIMLCGYEPFWDEDGEAATCENIIQGDLSALNWDDVSDSARDLVTKLLSVDPANRPTADEALNHPWTLGISTSSVPRDNMIKGLREYNARRRFRVATRAVMATRRAFQLLHESERCGAAETGFSRTGECKEYSRWGTVDSGSEGRMTEQKSLSLTTR